MMGSLWCFLTLRFQQAGLIGSVTVCAFTVILVSGFFLGGSVDADAVFWRVLISGGIGVALGGGAYFLARRVSPPPRP